MPNVDDFGLVVGINAYQGFTPLRGCHNDAQFFHDWLIASDGGDVPSDNVELIQSEPGYPRFDDIEDQIMTMVMTFRDDRRRRRRLYLYFAGHGVDPAGALTEFLVLMANATTTLLSRRSMPAYAAASLFARIAAFEEIVLFADCCRQLTRSAIDSALGIEGTPELIELLTRAAGNEGKLFYGVATSATQLSFELDLPPPGGGASVPRGRFSYAVLEALRNAADDTGAVTAETLENYVRSKLDKLPGGSDQNPRFDGDLVLARPGVQRARVVVTLNDPPAGLKVLRGQDLTDVDVPIVPVPGSPGAVLVELPAGRYLFVVPDGAGGFGRSRLVDVPEERNVPL